MAVELSEKVRKRIPESSLAAYDDIRARAMQAFAGHEATRREYMLAFALSFWVLLEYDKRRINLSKWARGYLYYFSTGCGKRLYPEELGEVEEFIASMGEVPGADVQAR